MTMTRSLRILALALCLAACDAGSTGGPTGPSGPAAADFGITVSPVVLEVEQGTIETITVHVDRTGGFQGALTLVPDSLPSGITIASVEVPAGATSVSVVVSTAALARPGNASFVLHAVAPGHPVVRTRVAIGIVPVVGSVELTVDAFPLEYDDTTLVHAVVRALDGSVIADPRVTWTTGDTSVIHLLDEEGTSVRVHGWGGGLGTVFALSDSTWGTAIVSVGLAPVDRIDVSAPKDTLYVGETMQAGALAWDSHGHSLNRLSFWSSSDTSVITLGELGEVRAVGTGEAYILVDADGLGTIGQRKVVVIGGRPAFIRVTPEAVRIEFGQRPIFTAVVIDEQGLAMEEQPAIEWSIDDESVAFISHEPVSGSVELMVNAEGTTTLRASMASDPAIVGSAQIVVDNPTANWTGDIGSIAVQVKVHGYNYDTETPEICVYDLVYTGHAVARTVLSSQYVEIRAEGEYSASHVSGGGDCLNFDESGTFSAGYLGSHDQQEHASSDQMVGSPNLTHVTMQLTATVPLRGSFDLQLEVTPYDASVAPWIPLTPVTVSVPMAAQN